MKLFRLVTTLLLVAVIVLFVRQNMTTFQRDLDFSLYLFIREDVRWTLKVSTVIFLAGFVGLLVGVVFMFRPFYHTRKALQAERSEKERLLAERAMTLDDKPAQQLNDLQAQARPLSEPQPDTDAPA
ncbi:hypothetical protein [Desulfosoma caldarium]|uniref:Uncharacterized protein n=1 Tax=Desulfosoma caldarium TaxID=610254 RepID=A0A3N1UM08_9BACT|nr:hypothetical protein [Desulfosoma caldarium]ROQ91113.1 hypothetical protein EDC27_2390 [Desulfosoma caldarium]